MRSIKILLAVMLAAGLAACAGTPASRAAAEATPQVPAKELAELKMIVFPGGFNWPLWVGQSQGFFTHNGVALKLGITPTVNYQMGGLINGTFDIAITPLDNLIAYREGQALAGVDGSDLVAVMGGDNGFLKLASLPEVRTIADLRGKELSVDSIATGYSFVMLEILERNGLQRGRDYTTVPIGNVGDRFTQLLDHKQAATMLTPPFDVLARQQGLNVLADATQALGSYQGMVAVVRRKWARDNEKELVGFIRAYRQSLAWLYAPANRDAAIALFRRNVEADAAAAETAYRVLLDPAAGFDPNARLNEEGTRTVLQLREKYGRPAKKLQPLAAYYDPRYYNAATP